MLNRQGTVEALLFWEYETNDMVIEDKNGTVDLDSNFDYLFC